MKKTQFDKMTNEDLTKRGVEFSEELASGRMKYRLGQFKKTSEFRRLRKEIARIQTELSNRSRQTSSEGSAQ